MSEALRFCAYSPFPVCSTEQLTRFVFSPMFVDKNGRLKSNFFDHAFSKGLSVQRHDLASSSELIGSVTEFLDGVPKAALVGVTKSSTKELRTFRPMDADCAAFGIIDAAEKHNPAHAEIIATRYAMQDADRLEAARHLSRCFGDGRIYSRSTYFNGKVWDGLSQQHRDRPVDKRIDLASFN